MSTPFSKLRELSSLHLSTSFNSYYITKNETVIGKITQTRLVFSSHLSRQTAPVTLDEKEIKPREI